MSNLLERFSSVLLAADEAQIRADPTLENRLALSTEGGLVVHYAPFEHIERSAKVVIAGITPGLQQAANALIEARKQLKAGKSPAEALRAAKVHASFSGPMRSNLITMLDYIGVHTWAGLQSSAQLWGDRSELVHFTSTLRYPVLLNGKNYSGAPSMVTTRILTALIEEHLREEALALPDAIWIPLGPAATSGVNHLVSKGVLSPGKVLTGLPHPSGANAERIAYFVGKKPREYLSAKTNAGTMDRVRTDLLAQMSKL
jgi:hypothetical protein